MAARLSRGDVYLCRFSPPDKLRPVLVLTREQAIGHLSSVTVAPITSTIRGVPSEVVLDTEDGVSQQRIGRRVARLEALCMNEVCLALRFSLGC